MERGTQQLPVSIFNDVIGPAMRGPSSSHTAASVRIASIARMLLAGEPQRATVNFSRRGSLATTHASQGSDIGLAAGFLNIGMESPDMPRSLELARERGMEICFGITDLPADHPNTYDIELSGKGGGDLSLTAISTGGGMIAVIAVDSFPVMINGDCWEALYEVRDTQERIGRILDPYFDSIPAGLRPDRMAFSSCGERTMLNLKFGHEPQGGMLNEISCLLGAERCMYASAVLPVISRREGKVLFTNAEELTRLTDTDRTELWEAGLRYEAARGAMSEKEVWGLAGKLLDVMRDSVDTGLAGTHYDDRILGRQSGLLAGKGRMLDAPLLNRIAQYVTAVMETKSSFGTIVAAPTAGSCGALPGAILACADTLGSGRDDCIKALLAAGVIGVFIASRSTFSAEVGGCQAECGAASGMAAAALVQLAGGSASEALGAASFALQNILGMVCDPVAARVEVPCLGKNILAATNALTACNLTLAGMDAVIPLDETIAAMDSVGRSIPFELRCTGLGGLSVTPTSKEIKKKLEKKRQR